MVKYLIDLFAILLLSFELFFIQIVLLFGVYDSAFNEVEETVLSPNKKNKVVQYYVSGGGAAGYTLFKISLIDSKESIPKETETFRFSGLLLKSPIKPYELATYDGFLSDKVKIKWINNQKVFILHPCPDKRDGWFFIKKQKLNGIQIDFACSD